MQMQMAVDMVEWEAGCVELRKLLVNFGPELLPEAALEKIKQSLIDKPV